MAVDCDPAALATAAKCYCYQDERQVDSILIYLLAQIAGNTATPSALAAAAKCYCFSDRPSRDAVITYLLCQIAAA